VFYGLEVWGEFFFVGDCVVGDYYCAFFCARKDCFEIICVFVFCGVEKDEVEGAWVGRNCFRGVAEDGGDVAGEIGFFEIFLREAVA